MFSRLLTVALLTAGTVLAISTAQAQTSGSGSTGSSTMSPSTGSSGSSMGSGSTGSMGSSSMGNSGSQQAQQPMSNGNFNASNYKTKTECLNAASAQKADRMMCNSVP